MIENEELDLKKIGLEEDEIGIVPLDAKEEILSEIKRIVSININNNQDLIDLIDQELTSKQAVLPIASILKGIYKLCLEDSDLKYREYMEDYFADEIKDDDCDYFDYDDFVTFIAYKFLDKNNYGKKISLQARAIDENIRSLQDSNSLREFFESEYGYKYNSLEKIDEAFEEWSQLMIEEDLDRASCLQKELNVLNKFLDRKYCYDIVSDYIDLLKKFISQYIIENRKYTEEDLNSTFEYIKETDSITNYLIEDKVRSYFSSKITDSKKKIYS